MCQDKHFALSFIVVAFMNTHTLFSVQSISQVLKVQMTSIFFPGKIRQFPRTFMSIVGSNSNVSNDILFKQEDKDFYQVKGWPPTQ